MNVNCYGHDIEYYRTETEYNTPLRLLKEGRINKIRKEGSWGFLYMAVVLPIIHLSPLYFIQLECL